MAASVRITVYAAEAIAEARADILPDRVHIAEAIADDARGSAPVLHGHYRDGIHVEVSGQDVRVVDDDPDAGFKEYGTHDTPAHATLTDAARKFGRYSGIKPKGRGGH